MCWLRAEALPAAPEFRAHALHGEREACKDIILYTTKNKSINSTDNHQKWDEYMAKEAETMMAKWPYRAVFFSMPFKKDGLSMRGKVLQLLMKYGSLLPER
ncbi:hypothetical protein OSTOST_08274, partial [Ostertagia ostertagi]